MAELTTNLAGRNHRSATQHPAELVPKLKREEEYGLVLSVWASLIPKIPRVMGRPADS